MSKTPKVTIKDIARECGVGLGTVSRVINSKPGVKDEVRRKVMQYIEDIGWRSNDLHSRLRIDETGRTVIFIASTTSLERKYDQDQFRMLLERSIAEGFTPITLFGQCRQNLERCLTMKPHAVVVIGVSSFQKEAVDSLLREGIRVIGIGECFEFAGPVVGFNHRGAAVDAVKLLLKSGHENIGFFGGMGIQNHIESLDGIIIKRIREMLRGIVDVLPEYDLSENVISDCFSDLKLLKHALGTGRNSAWLCSDEKMCRQFMYCADELGLRIPRDISIVGFTPELPFYSFNHDVTRYYPNNSDLTAKVMELLNSEPIRESTDLLVDYLYHRGNSIKG